MERLLKYLVFSRSDLAALDLIDLRRLEDIQIKVEQRRLDNKKEPKSYVCVSHTSKVYELMRLLVEAEADNTLPNVSEEVAALVARLNNGHS